MKSLLLSTTILLSLLNKHSSAADAEYCYQGEVAGVVCNACASNVKRALSKLEGVKEVRITLNKQGGNPRLTIISKSPAITREAAIRAMGKAAGHYEIISLNKTASR